MWRAVVRGNLPLPQTILEKVQMLFENVPATITGSCAKEILNIIAHVELPSCWNRTSGLLSTRQTL